MFITILNDCRSEDDVARQETRLASLFPGVHVSFFGVSADFSVNATLEAAGGLIDVLDAAEDREGFVLLNVAPRGDVKEDGHNGTAFCYFYYKNITVVSTIKGQALSLIKKLKLIDSVYLLSVGDVMEFAKGQSLISSEIADYIKTTQFRSYDFVPRVAAWLHQGVDLPHEEYSIEHIQDAPHAVWYVDDFGNCKTTLLAADMPSTPPSTVRTNLGDFEYYHRLKDLPKGETGIYLGSSGIGTTRFVEIATQKQAGSAAKTLSIGVGQEISFND